MSNNKRKRGLDSISDDAYAYNNNNTSLGKIKCNKGRPKKSHFSFGLLD